MEKEQINEIQKIISYEFSNKSLLVQAFKRKTYANENQGEHNDNLEFYGDEALDYSITRLLLKKYGFIDQNSCEFCSKLDSGELTSLKSYLVDKDMLSSRIKELDLAKYLIVGNGDDSIDKSKSVKEDLFEAIIGAVDIDSNHNLGKVDKTVFAMLNPEKYIEEYNSTGINYVEAIQQWNQAKNKKLPEYGIPYEKDKWYINLSFEINNVVKSFAGSGTTINLSKRDACHKAYDYLEANNLLVEEIKFKDLLGDVTVDNAADKFEMLLNKNYISDVEENQEEIINNDSLEKWKTTLEVKPVNSNEKISKEVNGLSKTKSRNAAKYAILGALVTGGLSIAYEIIKKRKK